MNFQISIALWLFLMLSNFSFAHAQVKQCPLDLNVIEYQKNAGAVEIPISGANAAATDIVTKAVTKAVTFEGMPRFAKLREGSYNLSVTKDGYTRTLKRIKIDCAGLDKDGSVSEVVFLWKGNPKETMKMIGVTLGVEGAGKSPKTSTPINSTNSESPTPKLISAGVINGKAKQLVKPEYPAAARAVGATGAVNVQVTIDEQGKVISASAISGHPLLRQAAENAAKASSFSETRLEGQPVKVTGIIVYNFVP